jgi:hypothetical protein
METRRTDAPHNETALSQSTSSQQLATELVDLNLLCSQFLVDDPEAYLDAPKAVEISTLGPSSPNQLFAIPLYNAPQPSPPVAFSETINPSLRYPSNVNPSEAPIPPSNHQAEPPLPPPAGLSSPAIGSSSQGNWYTTPPSGQENQTYDIDWEDLDRFLQSQSQEADYDHGLQIHLLEHSTTSATTSDRSSFAPSFILPLPPRTSAETETPLPPTPTPAAAPATTMVSGAPRRRQKKRLISTQIPLISSVSPATAVLKETIFTAEREHCDAKGVGNGVSKSPQSSPVTNMSSAFSTKTILLKDAKSVKTVPTRVHA